MGEVIDSKFEQFEPQAFYIVEPHEAWVKEGQVPISAIAERVYGKPFNALRACQAGDDSVRNDSVVLYDFSDEKSLKWQLEDFDEPRVYLGYDAQKGEGVYKEGVTSLDYWLSISWVGRDGATRATVDANPREGSDLQGAIFPEDFYAQRAYSPNLSGILADLIRRGELPQGRYLFKHWW